VWDARNVRRPDIADLGIFALAVGGALVDPRDPGEPRIGKEFVFSIALWALLGLLLRQAATTAAAAVSERRRARALRGVDPRVAASDAVRRERERLSQELDACIREALRDIRNELAAVDRGADAQAAARRIHLHARRATSELRRQLGLLRDADAGDHAAGVMHEPARPMTRATMALTITAMGLAAMDAWAGSSLYGPEFYTSSAWRLPWSGLLGIAVAATLIGVRVTPAAAALVAASLLVVPRQAGDVMVSAGFGLLASTGWLAWALARRGLRDAHAVAAALALAAAVVGSRLRDDPRNAGFLAACLGVIWVVGYTVGLSRRRRTAAERQAGARQAELDVARDVAVQSERFVVARELHDVVSHAVGVIAMQAAAAQVSWPADPDAALNALETVDHTATYALADLDSVLPGATTEPRRDLDVLIARIRATGTPVELVRSGSVDADPVVYRIVQEALTNAVRHAPGASVDVLVCADEDAIRVRVADDGPGLRASTTRGFGLVGLAERVHLQGGTLRTGPGAAGRGFVLEATLPRHSIEVP
jgi:signal transduction histidine kinase